MEKIMVMVESMEMIKCSGLEKKKEKNKMGLRQRYNYRAILFSVIKTL